MEFELNLGGRSVACKAKLEVVNPATGEVFAKAPCAGTAELEWAVESAASTQRSWADEPQRAARLGECAKLLRGGMVRLARLLTQEQGKPQKEAVEEVMGAVETFRYWSQQALEPPMTSSGIRVERRPMGVVGAITPWNFPIILAVWKIAPALLAGNTVILKPSPHTPLSSLMLGNLLQPALPPGVLNVVTGDDSLGSQLTAHAGIRKLSVTGSVPTGRAVARSAAKDFKRLTLELGGNDPAIILSDTDIPSIAKNLFWSAFRNCGQVCLAVKRVYAQETVYPALLAALQTLAETTRVGDGSQAGVELGPLTLSSQQERVYELVENARNRGAKVLFGGERLKQKGFFLSPAIVTNIDDDAPLVREEQFGPALPIMPYATIDEAIKRANSSELGLGASLWTGDPQRAQELASALDCGTVWINQHGTTQPGAPIGGRKCSGIGYENGIAGLAEYSELQTIYPAT